MFNKFPLMNVSCTILHHVILKFSRLPLLGTEEVLMIVIDA